MHFQQLFIRFAYGRGKIICEKLKEIIPKQMFEVPIQAALQGK